MTETPSQVLSIGVMEIIGLLVCVLAAVGPRVIHLNSQPLWTDEITTLITARRPMMESFFNYQDPQPPLYQMLLRPWLETTDPLPWLLRAPSVIAGCLLVPTAWWFVRMLSGRGFAAVAAFLVAVNPMLIHYSREARPYSLFALTALLSLGCFYCLLKRPSVLNFLCYTASTAAMFYCHYYAMFYLAAEFVFLAADWWFCAPGERRAHVQVGFAGGLAVLLSLLPLSMFAWLLRSGMPGAWWIGKPSPVSGFEALGDFLGLQALGILCVIPLAASLWLTRSGFDQASEIDGGLSRFEQPWWSRRQKMILCTLAVVFGLFVPLAISIVVKPGFVPRYALPVAVPMILLGLAYLWSVSPAVCVAMLVLVLGFQLPKVRSEIRPKPGMPDVVGFLHKNTGPGQKIYVMDWSAPDKFKEDFKHPEVMSLRYYGFKDRELEVLAQPPVWNPKAIKDYRLPDEPMWVVGFGSTTNPVTQHLGSVGRAYSVRDFDSLHVVTISGRSN